MPMTKEETLQFLRDHDVPFEITEHPAVFNMAEMAAVELPYPECDAKNLFVRDDRKRNRYLITVVGTKRVDLKAFREQQGLRRLSFASDEDLMHCLGLEPGSVTPLGILNDEGRAVHVFLDEDFVRLGRIGVQPNDNTATVWIATDDLIRILREHGNTVEVVPMQH